jgi:hypothetical protein
VKHAIATAAIAVALATGSSHAGGIAEPVTPPAVIIADTSATNTGHLLVPALFVLFVLATTN